jgi:hypothetical protein
MRFTPITILYLLFFISSNAQKLELKPEAGFGFVFYNFTSDSLIPPNRTNALHVGTTGFVNVRINLQTVSNRWLFSTGIGINTNRTTFRENNEFDRFFDQFLLFWGSGGDLLTKNILLKYQNINLPVGVAYNLNRKNPDKFQSYFGIDANLQFNIGKQVKIYAPSYNYTASETKQMSENYKQRVEPFVIMFMPKFEFRTNIHKNTRHAFIISPFSFYSHSQLKGLTVNPLAIQMAYAVSFQLN